MRCFKMHFDKSPLASSLSFSSLNRFSIGSTSYKMTQIVNNKSEKGYSNRKKEKKKLPFSDLPVLKNKHSQFHQHHPHKATPRSLEDS